MNVSMLSTFPTSSKSVLILQEHRNVSLSEWLAIADNPRQRNTVSHARKAIGKHLSEPSLTHLEVSAAKLPDGTLYKLDGHTRAMLWESGSLGMMGDKLFMTIYPVNSLEEAKDLYEQFDNQAATEIATDRGYGALREAGIYPKSNLLLQGKISTSLEFVESIRIGVKSGFKLNQAVLQWRSELVAIDELRISSPKMNSWILATALLTIRKKPDTALEFWKRYRDNEGVKTGRVQDGVEQLSQYVKDVRLKKQVGSSWINTHTPMAVCAFERYRKNRMYEKSLQPDALTSYLAN